ncbi:peptide mating pheromone precursor bbp2-3 [Schizophyllum commune]
MIYKVEETTMDSFAFVDLAAVAAAAIEDDEVPRDFEDQITDYQSFCIIC